MKVLLDECLPRKLKLEIDADFVQTVPEAGWAGKQNGELLKLAEVSFDVLPTNDQNMEYQQNLNKFDFGVHCPGRPDKRYRRSETLDTRS